MSGGIDPLVEALGLAPKQDGALRKKLFDSLPRLPYTGYHVHSVERLTAPGRALLERPEIEDEINAAIRAGGAWSVKDNKMVAI